MAEEIVENALNTDPNWYDSIAPDAEENTAARETLSNFDTPAAFLESYDSLANADWRDPIAGDDDKFKSDLQRFGKPSDFGTAYREGKATISAGLAHKPLAEDASDDDVKAYREANGPFRHIEDLSNVKGIGVKTVEKNRSNLVIDVN